MLKKAVQITAKSPKAKNMKNKRTEEIGLVLNQVIKNVQVQLYEYEL